MRLEDDNLTVWNVDLSPDTPPSQPILKIHWLPSQTQTTSPLAGPIGRGQNQAVIDVTFRYQTSVSATDAKGILGVSNNVTGDFIVEVSTDAELIQQVISAARRYRDSTNGETAYILRLSNKKSMLATFEKRVLLVYAPDGTLLRHRSLIPAGIEI